MLIVPALQMLTQPRWLASHAKQTHNLYGTVTWVADPRPSLGQTVTTQVLGHSKHLRQYAQHFSRAAIAIDASGSSPTIAAL